ncbi:MAG TPA: toprim domain-containing protein [Candidatus Bathyarchaeia archaeon]
MNEAGKRDDLDRLKLLLSEIELNVDLVLVEGQRDVEALRSLGYAGSVATCSRFCVNYAELAEMIAGENDRVLVLTDFDQEGNELNARFSELLERMGVVVEKGLRGRVARLMAALEIHVVEALDNVSESLRDVY